MLINIQRHIFFRMGKKIIVYLFFISLFIYHLPLYFRTHDDLFIIYAALYSGERCQIVSRDLMRSHSFLVGNLRRLFLKWQKRNHCLIKSIRPQVIYDPPQLFNANCHKVENYWHLPVDVTDTDSDKISLKQFWMDTNYYCLKIDQ